MKWILYDNAKLIELSQSVLKMYLINIKGITPAARVIIVTVIVKILLLILLIFSFLSKKWNSFVNLMVTSSMYFIKNFNLRWASTIPSGISWFSTKILIIFFISFMSSLMSSSWSTINEIWMSYIYGFSLTRKKPWVFVNIKYRKFWNVLLDHFVECKPLIFLKSV